MGRKKKDNTEEPTDFSKLDNSDIIVDASYYKGNENLLKNDAQIKWTPELIEEFEKCTKNILHFSENYFYINTIDEGKQKIKPYKYQKRLLRAFRDNRFNIILSSRQSGKTTTITIYALWIVCFQADKRITIVANKEYTAKEIFSRIRMAFEELPVWMKPSVKSWRKDGFQLGNDSEIKVSTSSTSGPRGSTSNLLIIDEMAHCPNEVMNELWKSAIPIISSSKKSQIVVISTPNGTDNKFYELYKESQKQNSSWHLETVNWDDVPGRDEEWKRETLSLLNNNLDDFEQEYCNVFHEPGKTTIDPELLKVLKSQCKDPVYVLDDGNYKIYTEPDPKGI
jgi:hypothetical protein